MFARAHGFVFKRITVSDRTGEYRFGINSTLSRFRNLVDEALTKRKEAIDEKRKRERVHVLIDFSFLKNYMKKGGLTLATLKCPECNAPLKMPKVGTEVECKYCNNTIYAQDIFKKVKDLIG